METAAEIFFMKKHDYQERTYRNRLSSHGLKTFQVVVRETDLYIAAHDDLTLFARDIVYRYRGHLEHYIKLHPEFLTSLVPLPEDAQAPEIVRIMLSVSAKASVGPMAAVAGALAEFVGRDLSVQSSEVIVENGGDIYLNCKREMLVGVFAGESPLSNKLTLKLDPRKMPLGICTSSGTVGPSLSFGRADAVCIISHSAALADAAASNIGNRIKTKKDIYLAIEMGSKIPGVIGILIIIEDRMGVWGDVELI
jgi:uncharacterized protein